jgi:4'-phosphopantetheinyl transferase
MNTIASSDHAIQLPAAWDRPVFPLHLSTAAVHLWRFWLNQPDPQVYACVQLLSPNERRRTASLYSVAQRKRFIIARGMLRTILGSYLNLEPTQLEFGVNPHGKPFLSGHTTADLTLQFNLTHAHGLALCAVTATRRLGIDLEWVHNRPYIPTAIQTFFSTREANRIRLLPTNQRVKAFYQTWTRKEAYAKALGTGIYGSFPLTDPRHTSFPHATSEDGLWTAVSIEPSLNYVATLIVEGHNFDLRAFHLGVNEYLINPMQQPACNIKSRSAQRSIRYVTTNSPNQSMSKIKA